MIFSPTVQFLRERGELFILREKGNKKGRKEQAHPSRLEGGTKKAQSISIRRAPHSSSLTANDEEISRKPLFSLSHSLSFRMFHYRFAIDKLDCRAFVFFHIYGYNKVGFFNNNGSLVTGRADVVRRFYDSSRTIILLYFNAPVPMVMFRKNSNSRRLKETTE